MKNKFIYKLAKKAAVCCCLGVSAWCAGSALKDWVVTGGTDAILFAAGIGRTEAISSSVLSADADDELLSSTAALPVENDFSDNRIETLETDGIVPFHEDELPNATVTPDPNRTSGMVEELTIDGGTQIDNFFVRDTSDSDTDLAAELLESPSVSFKRDGSVEILIYHTHTSEAYSKNFTGFYYTDMETRTANQEMSVVAVGEALKKQLEAGGFGVVHDTTVNDEIFNGSYSRSWEVIQKNLEEYPTIQVTIDLHRDSMTTESGTKYKPTVTINGRRAAQVMLLAGCDANGDWGDFPNWRENLRLILRAQQKITALYPQLARPLSFSDCKYNMNATTGSMLIEVGTEVSTISEAEYSGKLLGEALTQLFSELQ